MVEQVLFSLILGRHTFDVAFDNRNQRILDVLNEEGSEFLRLSRVSGTHAGEGCVNSGPTVVPKSSIDAVVLSGDRHENPLRRRHAFVEKRAYRALFVLSEWEVRGELMFSGRPDPMTILGSSSPSFFPIVATDLSRGDDAIPQFKGSVALINKQKVRLIQIDEHVISRPNT